jgi:O-antigen/teichoic acid export membrane protein
MFAQNVLKMISAPILTQILALILMPIISRLYSPEVYGLYNLYGSIIGPLSVFVTMGYNNAILLPESDEAASNLLCLSLCLSVTISVIMIPCIFFFSEFLSGFLKSPELSAYMWMIPLSLFTTGLFYSLLSWNIRNRWFGRIAISRVTNSAIEKSIIIGAGLTGTATTGSLIWAALSGSIIMSFILGGRLWKDSKQLLQVSRRWGNIIHVVKRYRKFPIFNISTDLFYRVSDSISLFLIAYYFSKAAVGYYGMALMVLNVPIVFVGNAVGEVFAEKAARLTTDKHMIAQSVEKIFELSTLMAMLPLLLIAVIGDQLFGFIFGNNWEMAGVYAQILSFKLFFSFLVSPITSLPNILEKQEYRFFLNIGTTIISIVCVLIGGYYHSVTLALYLLSFANGLILFVFLLVIFNALGIDFKRICSILIKYFLYGFPIISVLFLVKMYAHLSFYTLIIPIIASCIIHYVILIKKSESAKSLIMMVLNKRGLSD